MEMVEVELMDSILSQDQKMSLEKTPINLLDQVFQNVKSKKVHGIDIIKELECLLRSPLGQTKWLPGGICPIIQQSGFLCTLLKGMEKTLDLWLLQ